MSDEQDFALKASTEAPWWSKAPIYLSLGVVGVPSLLAIGMAYYIAANVTRGQKVLEQYNLSELQQLNGIDKQQEGILRFVEADLRVQYKTCLAASKTDEAKEACITAAEREHELGLAPDQDGH